MRGSRRSPVPWRNNDVWDKVPCGKSKHRWKPGPFLPDRRQLTGKRQGGLPGAVTVAHGELVHARQSYLHGQGTPPPRSSPPRRSPVEEASHTRLVCGAFLFFIKRSARGTGTPYSRFIFRRGWASQNPSGPVRAPEPPFRGGLSAGLPLSELPALEAPLPREIDVPGFLPRAGLVQAAAGKEGGVHRIALQPSPPPSKQRSPAEGRAILRGFLAQNRSQTERPVTL